jgi:prepilin-type N-terminal cleavage/methylation domain-containing protein
MLRNHDGFTLMELIIAMALGVILMAISYPNYRDWRQSAAYKEVSRKIASTMLDARARSVSSNREHRVTLTLDGSGANSANTYAVEIGNRSRNSTEWNPVPAISGTLTAGVEVRGVDDCSQLNGTIAVTFTPKGGAPGAGPATGLCVMDTGGALRFSVGVADANTGRVAIH